MTKRKKGEKLNPVADQVKDIRRSLSEGRKKVPSWLKKPRSVEAELSYQHRRLKG